MGIVKTRDFHGRDMFKIYCDSDGCNNLILDFDSSTEIEAKDYAKSLGYEVRLCNEVSQEWEMCCSYCVTRLEGNNGRQHLS